jgi:hypothetical protein
MSRVSKLGFLKPLAIYLRNLPPDSLPGTDRCFAEDPGRFAGGIAD